MMEDVMRVHQYVPEQSLISPSLPPTILEDLYFHAQTMQDCLSQIYTTLGIIFTANQ